jgi:hypothetical protein
VHLLISIFELLAAQFREHEILEQGVLDIQQGGTRGVISICKIFSIIYCPLLKIEADAFVY